MSPPSGPSPSAGDRPGNGSISAPPPSGEPVPPPAADAGDDRSARHESATGTGSAGCLDERAERARGDATPARRRELERRVSEVRHRIDEWLDSGVELGAQTRERVHRGLDSSRDAITERPLSYLAIAAVGGLILGLLLNRRH